MQGLRTVCQKLKVLKINQYGEEKVTLHYCDGDKKYYIKKIYSYSKNMLNILQKIKQASSPHLSKIYEIKYSQSKIECIEEYYSYGNLQEIHQNNKLDTIQIITCFNDIVNGLKQLKDLGYMHRDIKPQNILFDGRNYLISDFETVKTIENDEKRVQSQVGTKLFCAPEILMMQNYSSKCDIWSLGCLLYYLMNNSYLELNQQQIAQISKNGIQITLPQNKYPQEMNDLLSKMLKKENERISLDQVSIQIKINNSNLSGCTTANTSQQSQQNQLNDELNSEQIKELIQNKLNNERDLGIQYYLLTILEFILSRRYSIQDENIGNQRLFILQLYEINNLSLQNQQSSLNIFLDIYEIKQLFQDKGIYQDVINLFDY